MYSTSLICINLLTSRTLTRNEMYSSICKLRKGPRWRRFSLFLDEITRESFKESFGTPRVSMLRYVAPTASIYTYVHGSWTARSRETRRDETREEKRRSYSAGLTAQLSTWIMPVPVRPTRTCPWNSRSRARLDASLCRSESRLQPRCFVGRILTVIFFSFHERVLSVYQSGVFRRHWSVYGVDTRF